MKIADLPIKPVCTQGGGNKSCSDLGHGKVLFASKKSFKKGFLFVFLHWFFLHEKKCDGRHPDPLHYRFKLLLHCQQSLCKKQAMMMLIKTGALSSHSVC